MNGRVASTQWLISLLLRTMSCGEVILSLLNPGYKQRKENLEGDSDKKHQGRRRAKPTTAGGA